MLQFTPGSSVLFYFIRNTANHCLTLPVPIPNGWEFGPPPAMESSEKVVLSHAR